MTCASCEKIVSKKLKLIQGVEEVLAEAQTGNVTLSGSREIGQQEIVNALQGTHYSLIIHS